MLDFKQIGENQKVLIITKENKKSRGRPGLVKIGYGGPKEARGLHPSGFTDNLVFNLNDLVN